MVDEYGHRCLFINFSDEESFEGDEDDRVYEDLSEYSSGRGSLEIDKKTDADTAKNKISTLEMFGKKGTVLRTLWAEMPEVWPFYVPTLIDLGHIVLLLSVRLHKLYTKS